MKVKIDMSGRDSACLSNCHRYLNGLYNLELYRNPPEKAPSLEQLKPAIADYEQCYENGVNGDRVWIAKRKKARKNVCEMFEKVCHYLEVVATENDIPALLQAGFEVPRAARRKTAAAPAAG